MANPVFSYAFIDFDSTLYETDQLVAAMWNVYKTYGVAEADFLLTLDRAINGASGDYFDFKFETQIDLLAAMGYKVPATVVLAQLQALLNTNYAAADAEVFLQRLRPLCQSIVLLTAGNENFQQAKLQSTGLATYFDDTVIVSNSKEDYVKSVLPEDARGLFVNDQIEQNVRVRNLFSNLLVVGRKHPRRFGANEAAAEGIPYFSTLTEIVFYVEQNLSYV